MAASREPTAGKNVHFADTFGQIVKVVVAWLYQYERLADVCTDNHRAKLNSLIEQSECWTGGSINIRIKRRSRIIADPASSDGVYDSGQSYFN